MFIVVNHTIPDPDVFWGVVRRNDPIPTNLTLHAVYPSTDMMRAVCIWEAEDVDAVNNFLAETFGNLTLNEVLIVNEELAIGLPREIVK